MATERATTATETTAVTYLQLISKDEKQVQKENLVIKAQEAALTVAREILALNSAISVKKGQIEKAQRAIPYDVTVEFKLTKELTELQAALEFAQGVKESRFTDATI